MLAEALQRILDGMSTAHAPERAYVKINGVDQGMVIESRSTRLPVLLFVHGGPGMPEYW